MSEALEREVREIVALHADEERTVLDVLLHRHAPEAVAYVTVDVEGVATPHTYAELADRSARIATVLRGLGVGPGDRVASLVGKCFDLPATILAAWRLGAVYLPSSPPSRPRRCGTGWSAPAPRWSSPTGCRPGRSPRARGPCSGWTTPGSRRPSPRPSPPRTAAGPPRRRPSCTSSRPAPRDARSPWCTRAHHLAGWTGYLRFALGLEPGAVFWSAADPGWAYGLYTVLIGPLTVGVPSIVSSGNFNAERTWDLLERLEVTDFAAAPTALRALKNRDAGRELPHLRRISSAGEPLSPDVFEWTDARGHPVHDHYGQTELGMCAGFPQAAEGAPAPVAGATGVSLPGWRMAVLATDGDHEAGPGEMGRLVVDVDASPFMSFVGYGSDRDEPLDKFTPDGRHYLTGDLATKDAQGIIRFMSRDDDVILMAGYRIGPFDIESTLSRHPAVATSAVVAAPDEERGEIVHAFVVLAEGTEPSAELTAELQEFVKSTYARHAYPRAVTYLDELPATPSGKIRRNVLRDQVRD